jgi:hypothetical protein
MRPKCKIHGVPLVCFCPACRGSVRNRRKAEASRQNGHLGGRPKMPWGQLSEAGKRARKRRAEKSAKREE